MITNKIGQLTELQANGGGYFTESFPTNFHHFYKRKVLVGNETADMFKDVTASDRSTIEAADAKWTEPSASLIERAKAAGVVYNRATGFFSHNGINDLTAAEVTSMLAHINEIFLPGGRRLRGLKARTNIVTTTGYGVGWGVDFVNLDGVCGGNGSIEVLVINDCQISASSELTYFCSFCPNLREIIGILDVSYVKKLRGDHLRSAGNLKEVRLFGIKVSISFKDCRLLSLASLQYLVDNAANTSAITVTVHPEVYAKLTSGDTAAEALLPENLAGDILNHSGNVNVIDNGVQLMGPGRYVRLASSTHLISNVNARLTIACDVEGLGDGESITLNIGSGPSRAAWEISSNGRSVFSFNGIDYMNDTTHPEAPILLFDMKNTYNGTGVKLSNFKLSYGEHSELPYTEPFSKIEDEALREKAEWLSLMQIAEARQINFVTTE